MRSCEKLVITRKGRSDVAPPPFPTYLNRSVNLGKTFGQKLFAVLGSVFVSRQRNLGNRNERYDRLLGLAGRSLENLQR